jgi:hypothetical protein
VSLRPLASANGGGSGSFLCGADPPFFPAPYVVGTWTVD